MPIFLPTTVQSKCIHYTKTNILSCRVTLYWTGGNLRFFISNTGTISTVPTQWEEVTGLSTGVEKLHTFTSVGQGLYFKIVKDYSTIIGSTQNSLGEWTLPGIRIRQLTFS